MTALAPVAAPPDAQPDFTPANPRARHDGWTPDRQRAFLEAISEGHTVDVAARKVGMSRESAYQLRRRAGGASFALGWAAANLIARDVLADTLLARALDGQVDSYTRADGSTVTRHRHDNRLATALLARLDRQVEQAPGAETHAARLVAREFEAFLDLVEREGGPAQAGLFLAGRASAGDDPDLAAIAGLARADRWVRTGAGLAAEVDTADLDPARRECWTAEQWTRAEAAGLVAMAPAAAANQPGVSYEVCEVPDEEEAGTFDYWWSEQHRCYRTNAHPPEGFAGRQEGLPPDYRYQRDMTRDELQAWLGEDGWMPPEGDEEDEEAPEEDEAAVGAAVGEGDQPPGSTLAEWFAAFKAGDTAAQDAIRRRIFAETAEEAPGASGKACEADAARDGDAAGKGDAGAAAARA